MADRTEVLIRHFRDGDDRQINDLFNRIFETDRSLQQWRWKFQADPASLARPNYIVLGEAEGKIVSQYAGVARDLWMRGELRKAVQIVDNVIDPEFRGGRQLQKQMFAFYGKHVLAQGNEFIFGCPNSIAYRVGKRLLGYDDVFSAPRLFRRLSLRLTLRRHLPAPLNAVADALGRLSASAVRLVLRAGGRSRYRIAETIDERFDRLWDLAKERFTLLGVRDRKYLQWRYFRRPDARFRLLSAEGDDGLEAWVVLNVTQKVDGSRVGYVMDFLYLDPEVMQQLLRRGLDELSRMGADYAEAVAAPGSAGETLLREVGFGAREGLEPVRMVIVWYAMKDEPSQSVVLNPRSWHLCHGDLDLEL